MGQAVTVTVKPTSTPNVVRYELNRSLTGMGHEHYPSAEAAERRGQRPPDVLAQRLFATGKVDRVHCYSNMCTVHLKAGTAPESLLDIFSSLYIHYLPGVQPSIPG
ncbi:MAG TPA: hypothetical protein VM030_04010 [Acidimicrobiales bacterium]|nr:hypothetical protein [Acidimicrobiales bacterium]